MSDYDMNCPRCGRHGTIHAMASQCYACDEDDERGADELVKVVDGEQHESMSVIVDQNISDLLARQRNKDIPESIIEAVENE